MLLLPSETLPEGREWLYELKLDGYRALAIKSGGKIQLRSRNDNDFTGRHPKLAKVLEPLHQAARPDHLWPLTHPLHDHPLHISETDPPHRG